MRRREPLIPAHQKAFQSTHPHGVRQPRAWGRPQCPAVSIHAPAWGATHRHSNYPDVVKVSIHAPAWGATLINDPHTLFAVHGFNPRTRMGCDVGNQLCPWTDAVSIHAPAWGATRRNPSSLHSGKCFNPRTRMGCDASGFRLLARGSMFQSTHPHGVRPIFCSPHLNGLGVSIHAPAWGATLVEYQRLHSL